MQQVIISSGDVSRRVTWDQAVAYLYKIKCSESVPTLRENGSVSVPFNGHTVTLTLF